MKNLFCSTALLLVALNPSLAEPASLVGRIGNGGGLTFDLAGVHGIGSGGSSNCSPPSLSCVTVPTGLAFWMPFDTSTTSGTTTNDVSGNSNNGTLNAGASIVTGEIQQAVSVASASNQYASVGNAAVLTPSSMTVTAWIRGNVVSERL